MWLQHNAAIKVMGSCHVGMLMKDRARGNGRNKGRSNLGVPRAGSGEMGLQEDGLPVMGVMG